MSEQRQRFRFRLPWISSARPPPKPATQAPPPPLPNAPPPPASPPRPASISAAQPPLRSSVSQPSSPRRSQPQPPPADVSTVRPPFRSSASQPSSPSGSTTGSGVASQPTSPPRAVTLQHASSLPSSPVRPQISSSTSLEHQKTQEKTIPEETKPSSPRPKPPSELQLKTESKAQLVPESQKIYSMIVTTQRDEIEADSAKARDVHPNPEPESENFPQKTKEEQRPADELLKQEKEKARTHEESKKQQESLDMKKPAPASRPQGLSHSHHEGSHRVRDSRHKLWKGDHDHASLHREIRENTMKLVRDLTTGKTNFRVDDSDNPVNVITVAGENKGASMYLSSDSESGKMDAPIHIHRGYKTNPDESIDATTDVEDISKQNIVEEPKKLEEEATPEAYVNSNVQSVNNSIVFESSISEGNPGVEILFSVSRDKHTELSSDKVELAETHRAEFNPTQAEKLTYQPHIRRRCLRGLFLESSESDLDNPDKPRLHGCRYGCWERTKDRDVNVQ